MWRSRPRSWRAWSDRPLSRPTREKSTAVTSHPWAASQMALRPSPAATSNARPGTRPASSDSTNWLGREDHTSSVSAYRRSQSRASMEVTSGEREEELLHLGGVQGGSIAFLDHALPQPGGDDRETGLVEGAADGGELRDDVLALAALVEHLDDAAELPLGALEAVDHRDHLFGGQFHLSFLLLGLRGQRGQCLLEALLGLVGDRLETLIVGHGDHGLRVDGLDHRPVSRLTHHDVAGQEQPDGRLGLQRRVSERWPARTEDDLCGHVDVELLLQRGLDVDLGEHAEALLAERLADRLDSVVVRRPDGRAQCVAHALASPFS